MNEISNRIVCGILNRFDLLDIYLLIKFSEFSLDDFQKEIENIKTSKTTTPSLFEEKYNLITINLKGNFLKKAEKNSYIYVKKIYDQIQNLTLIYTNLKGNPNKKLTEKEKKFILELIPSMNWIFLFTILFFKTMIFLNSKDKNERENAFLSKFLYNIQILWIPIDISFVVLSKMDLKLISNSIFKIKEISEIQQRIDNLANIVKNPNRQDLRNQIQSHFVKNFLVDFPMSIENLILKLDILPSFEGVLRIDEEINSPFKEIDIFTSENLNSIQHRKCKLCGRITKFELSKFFQSLRTSCWICGSYWKLEMKKKNFNCFFSSN